MLDINPILSPTVVVLNAIINCDDRMAISPVPKADNPGPNGINVPNNPQPGPTLLIMSVNLNFLAYVNSEDLCLNVPCLLC